MVAQSNPSYITPEEYLRQEREADTKSEYDNGVIVAMAGASSRHVTITYNLGVELRPHLRRNNCRGFPTDLRVRVPACNKYYYPDFSVTCGKAEFEILEGMEGLLNPILIAEVLSPTTANYDLGEKWICYRTLASLSTYLLIYQDKPKAEVYTRLEDGDWRLHVVESPEATIVLSALNCELTLSALYADIAFDEESANQE